MRRLLLLGCLGAAACGGTRELELLTAADLAAFTSPAPTAKIAYGEDPLQFGELRMPSGPGPHPVAVLIHGGCWLAQYDIVHIGRLAQALAEAGVATWALEYRRVGNPGGGWPGTFADVAAGTDHLRTLATAHNLDLDRTVAVGHSAGGHLALWLAARSQLSADSELYASDPLPLRGVLGLAPAADLRHLHELGVCGNVIDKLMGGSPAQFPHRYAQGSATELIDTNIPQVVLVGVHDTMWTPVARRYERAALDAGARLRTIVAPDSSHFEMIDPSSSTWPLVRDAVLALAR